MAEEQAKTLPWQVLLWPDWYDDDEDHGYFWSGEAVDEKDAVRQACAECMASNDIDADDPLDADRVLDPEAVDYTDAGLDHRELYARLKVAAKAVIAAFGGDVPDWLRTEIGALESSVVEAS